MSWVGWVISAFVVLGVIGNLMEKPGKTSRKSATKRPVKGSDQAGKAFTFNRQSVPFTNGVPDVDKAISRAKTLYASGKEKAALELLHDCRNICGELEEVSSVQRLSNEIIGLRMQNAADAVSDDVLAEIARHPSGIVQTALYKELPDLDAELVRFAAYRLAEAGRITREKKGRSYVLRLAEQDKLE